MPYAYGAKVEHEFETDHLNIWLTFRHPMDQNLMPPLALWLLEADAVSVDIVNSAWQDEFTLLLTSDTVAAHPDRVLLEYNGPNSNLQTTWGKDWEPWGPILSTDIGKAPCFVDRGDATGWDYTEADFIEDSNWHELDLSGIVPANAKAVSVYLKFRATAANRIGQFRKFGNTNAYNVSGLSTQVANIDKWGVLTVALSTDHKIDYFFTTGTYPYIRFLVKGWWF